jgi:hypothetical protein
MPNAWNVPDGVGFKRRDCPHCTETKRQLSALEVEMSRHIEARNGATRILHEYASRLEVLEGWRELADQMDPDIPAAHRTTWSRLVQALEAATE